MNKFTLAVAAALVSATSAFAESSILDVYMPEPFNASSIDRTATASIGGVADIYEGRGRLGDGSPVYVPSQQGVDNTATSAIGSVVVEAPRGRLGDGSPAWF